jgi:hypothetical protein
LNNDSLQVPNLDKPKEIGIKGETKLAQNSARNRTFGINCPNCSGVISDKDIYCPHCGVNLDELNVQKAPIGKSSDPKLSRVEHDNTGKGSTTSYQRNPVLINIGFLSIVTSFLIFVLAISHFPSSYWDQGVGDVLWYKIDGLEWVNDKPQYKFSLIQPEKGDPTIEELTQLALNINPAFFTGSPINEMIYLRDFTGGEDFRISLVGKGFDNLVINLAAFKVVASSRTQNGYIAAIAGVVFGFILILCGRVKEMRTDQKP